MFIDASALCAILLDEEDGLAFERCIASTERSWTSAVAVWETVRAVARENDRDIPTASAAITAYLARSQIEIAPIGEAEQVLALEAFDRFGKGRHPARLNMGDCFAYACARAMSAPLLFKGDDFAQTDIEPALKG
ncbi:type II toxin-antitoxin system VapC family toxin [Brevundimonas staleyi]|uniref:Ribonuclease VapC n=1 Tax=Brevundimonas staleyi TaxID=74326 RepID=A0ABW0FVV7_9CAUL